MTMPANPGLFGQAAAEAEERKRQYGQITGVTPVAGPVPGIMEVQTANGGTRRFVGNTPGMETVRGAMMSPNPNVATGPAPTQTGPANEWEPYKTSEDGMQVLLRKGGDPSNPRDVREVVPGRAATKGGLAEKGRTVAGGYTKNEAFLEALGERHEADMFHTEQGRQEAANLAAEQRGFIQEQQAQAKNDLVQAQRDKDVQVNEIAALRDKYAKAEKDFVDTANYDPLKDPKKAGRVVIGGLLGSLGASLGALGATVGRTPNFAAEALERDAQRRMRQDEAQLAVKKETKDNIYGQLKDQMGSSALAQNAYLAIKAKQDMLGAQMLASKEKDIDRQQSFYQLASIREEAYLKYVELYGRNAEGEVTKSYQYIPGSAGSAGGIRSARGSSVDKRDPNAPGAKPPDSMPLVATTAVADDASLVALGNKILTNPAMKDSDSEFWGPKGSITTAIPGGSYVAGSDENRLQQDMQQYLNVRIKQMTGAGMAESEASRLAKAEIGSGSANDIRRGVANGTLTAARRARSNLATQDPRNRESLLKEMDPYSKQLIGGGK